MGCQRIHFHRVNIFNPSLANQPGKAPKIEAYVFNTRQHITEENTSLVFTGPTCRGLPAGWYTETKESSMGGQSQHFSQAYTHFSTIIPYILLSSLSHSLEICIGRHTHVITFAFSLSLGWTIQSRGRSKWTQQSPDRRKPTDPRVPYLCLRHSGFCTGFRQMYSVLPSDVCSFNPRRHHDKHFAYSHTHTMVCHVGAISSSQ